MALLHDLSTLFRSHSNHVIEVGVTNGLSSVVRVQALIHQLPDLGLIKWIHAGLAPGGKYHPFVNATRSALYMAANRRACSEKEEYATQASTLLISASGHSSTWQR